MTDEHWDLLMACCQHKAAADGVDTSDTAAMLELVKEFCELGDVKAMTAECRKCDEAAATEQIKVLETQLAKLKGNR